jgi:integrase
VTLRAALNYAWREGRIPRNDAWVRVKPFPETERARSRFLSRDKARRLINACSGRLRDLVKLALLSGARFSELAALNVQDFHAESGTLHIRTSKSGHPRHIVLNAEGTKFCSELVLGRTSDAALLTKDDGARWERDHQHRPFKEAVLRAKLEAAFTFHQLRHTWASLTIMPGAPLMVVAQNLGHSDTRMVERHYGHLTDSYVAKVIRSTSPKFGGRRRSNIVPIDRAASKRRTLSHAG